MRLWYRPVISKHRYANPVASRNIGYLLQTKEKSATLPTTYIYTPRNGHWQTTTSSGLVHLNRLQGTPYLKTGV